MHLFDVGELKQTADLRKANTLLAMGWELVAVIPLDAMQSEKNGGVALYLLGRSKTTLRFSDGWGETIKLQ
jgi:hypothetical protein